MSLKLIGNQELYQWDIDRILIIETDGDVSEIEFSHFDKTGNCSPLTFIGYVKQDNVGQKYVTIPNELLKWSAPIVAQYDDVSQIFKVIPKEKDETEREKDNNSFSPYSDTFGYGNTTGLKGYYIGAVDFDKHQIQLSDSQVTDGPPGTNIVKNESFITTYQLGDKFSIIVPDDHHILCGEIASIENNIITYKADATSSFQNFMTKEALEARFNNTPFADIIEKDDYTFSVPAKPFEGYVEISNSSFAEGLYNIAAGTASHAEGINTIAAGNFSHAEGYGGQAAYAAHAEGLDTTASGKGAHAEGRKTLAKGIYSHAEGYGEKVGLTTEAIGKGSHAEGYVTTSSGEASHAEGYYTEAEGSYSHAEGQGVKLSDGTIDRVVAKGSGAHAEGYRTKSNGNFSHAEGQQTTATGKSSHAEGYLTQAQADYAHAEGNQAIAKGAQAHAEGQQTEASGQSSHTEGYCTIATALGAHAEGRGHSATKNEASGAGSHAEGVDTKATKEGAHSEGIGTQATGRAQHVEGTYNNSNEEYLHILGNGTSDTKRSNAHTIDKDGNAWYAGHVYSGGKSQDDAAAIDLNEEIDNTKKHTQALQQTLSNALIGKTSGEAVSIKDISPVEHELGVKVSSKNLMNKDLWEGAAEGVLVKEDDVYTLKWINDARYTKIFPFYIPANTTITASIEHVEIKMDENIAEQYGTVYMAFYGTDQKTMVASVQFKENKPMETVTITKDVYYCQLFLISLASKEDEDFVKFKNLQVEVGTVATAYTPYVADVDTVKVKAMGKNLCNTPILEVSGGSTLPRIYLSMNKYPHLTKNISNLTLSADVTVYPEDTSETRFFDISISYVEGGASSAGRLFLCHISNNPIAYTFRDGKPRHYSATVEVDKNRTIKQISLIPLSASNAESPIFYQKAENIQLEIGYETEYEPYKEPVEYEAGAVEGIKSIYPSTTLTTDTTGAVIECEYNRDINKAFAELQNAILSLGGNI